MTTYPDYINLLVQINDSIIEINNFDKFRLIYAPVENKEEALSFAYALSGIPINMIEPIYDFCFLNDKNADYEFFQHEFKPTNVIEVPNGYEVNLFTSYLSLKSSSYEITYFVSKDGYLTKLREQYLFNDKNSNRIIREYYFN